MLRQIFDAKAKAAEPDNNVGEDDDDDDDEEDEVVPQVDEMISTESSFELGLLNTQAYHNLTRRGILKVTVSTLNPFPFSADP